METYAIRLLPGQDLKLEVDDLVRKENWDAACILTGIGSLRRVAIRFANQKEAEILEGPLEIISLGGTLSQKGSHLHISVSDSAGAVSAGHLTEGAIIYTTAEIVLGILPGWRFSREFDSFTGFDELGVKRVGSETMSREGTSKI